MSWGINVMNSRQPTVEEIEQLVSFLPRLYADGFAPVKQWGGGTKDKDGVITMGWPEYEDLVEEFFEAASAECWDDHGYSSKNPSEMLKNDDAVKSANLSEIKAMLTFCVRGERFCDGHWGAMIEEGHIRRLLERLSEFLEEGKD